MVRNNQITPQFYSLVNHFFRDIQAKQSPGSRLIYITYLYAGIVKAFLQWQRSVLLYFFQNILYP